MKEYYFNGYLEGFDKLCLDELEYGEVSSRQLSKMSLLTTVDDLMEGDKVYHVCDGAYNLYLVL